MTKKRIQAFIIITLAAAAVFAERTGFSGFSNTVSLDLPEHFVLKDKTKDNLSFMLESELVPVTAVVKLYKKTKINQNQEILSNVMKKFNFEYDITTFEYEEQNAALSMFTGNLGTGDIAGLAESLYLPEDKSTIVICAWYPAEYQEQYFFHAQSLLDAVYINMNSYFSAGPFTTFLYPKTEEEQITLTINGKTINTKIDANDAEAADFVVQREYTVLYAYQNSPLWKEAWQRYYRLIFRDSCARLRNVSFDIYNGLAPEAADETDLAQKLLTWTQNFEYDRETTSSDFVDVISAITGKGCDCDTRSMILCAILQNMNIDCVMFVSAVHSHAIAGLVSDHPGFAFEEGKKKYLTGETTAKGLTWGMIAQDMQSQNDWIPVLLP